MNNIAYVNGDYVAEADAKVSIFDRGFLFGDGVYEVVPIVDGHLVNHPAHMERLNRSLNELRLSSPVPLAEIKAIQEELMHRNDIREGRIYLQITRGVAGRDLAFPKDATPTLIMFGRKTNFLDTPNSRNGIKVKTLPDMRWQRRDIKTVMLLPSSLTKQQAIDEGFDDAWMVEDGLITEGSSNNAYIVKDGQVRTRQLSNDILAGCTRRALLQLSRDTGITVIEQAFSVAEAYQADEAFISSATTLVTPVVQIDDQVIGSGSPGPLVKRLREIYIKFAKEG